MGDWIQADADDIMSVFTTKSRTPLHRKSFNVSGLAELNFSPSPKKTLDFDINFCSKDNLDQCITHLNQELVNLGFPSMFHVTSDTFDLVLMVNNINELLKLHRKTIRQKDSFESRQQRAESDVSHLQLSICNLKESITQLEKERNISVEKERQTNNKNYTLISNVKAEKDEVRRLKSVMQHQDVQFKHELKKKERETNKLKERIHSLISDRNQERRFTMEISHPLQRSDGRRGTWKTNNTSNKHEEEMYNLIINSYEEKVQNFMVENHQLRECLKDLRRELKSALKSNPSTPTKYHSTTKDQLSEVSSIERCNGHGDDGDRSMSDSSDDLSEGHFQLPYDIVGEKVERSLRQKCRLLKARIRSKEGAKDSASASEKDSPDSMSNDQEDERQEQLSNLREQLSRYKHVIDQQESLILSMSTNLPTGDGQHVYPFLNDSRLLDEKRSLNERMKLFKEQRANFDAERKRFTDAAIRLGMERKTFEEERAAFMRTELMLTAPFTDKTSLSNRDANSADRSFTNAPDRCYGAFMDAPGAPKLRPSTPTFSPAPKRPVRVPDTPSTSELYRAIGVISDREKENQHCYDSESTRYALNLSHFTLPSSSTTPTPTAPVANSTRTSLPGNGRSSSSSLPGQRGDTSLASSSSRHTEHVLHVKHALFQQGRSSGAGGGGSGGGSEV